MPRQPRAVTRVLIRATDGQHPCDVFVGQAQAAKLETSQTKVQAGGKRRASLAQAKETACASSVDAVFALDRACELKLAQGYRDYRFEFDEEDRLAAPDWLSARDVMEPALMAALEASERARQDIRALESLYLRAVGARADWRQRARAILAAFEGHFPISRFEKRLLPSVSLTLRRVKRVALGASRLGGAPDMPPDMPWPVRPGSGHALTFIAQLALDELAEPSTGLPKKGSLLFFYDAANMPAGIVAGDDDAARVIYLPPRAKLARRSPPLQLSETAGDLCAVTMKVEGTLSQHMDSLDDDMQDFRLYQKLTTELCRDGTRLGGHPTVVQPTAEPSEDPRLLLHVSSDTPAGWVWFDVGYLYFWISRSDLRARRFDRVTITVESS